MSLDILNRRIALWRDEDGAVAALDARCPHLGADLGQGLVMGKELRCAFHHWRFDGDGRCVGAPGHDTAPNRCARTYPVIERFGLIWIFAGETPRFDLPLLPDGDDPQRFWRVLPPAQHIRCHPHLVIGNGLDTAHFTSLHGMVYSDRPQYAQTGPHELTVRLRGRPSSRTLASLIGVRPPSRGRGRGRDMVAKFVATAGNLAWLTVEEPLRFHVMFTGRPSKDRGCDTQTILFLPRGLAAVRAVLLLYCLLHSDRAVLDRLDFHAGFSATDGALRQFAEMINQMEAA